MELKNPARTEARMAFLHGVFTTAMEGGINYWSECEKYHWSVEVPRAVASEGCDRVADIRKFHAVIVSNDDEGWGLGVDDTIYQPFYADENGEYVSMADNPTKLVIDIDVVERGANLLVEKVLSGEFTNTYLLQFVTAWITNGENGDYDSCGADLAIQLGLFGEVVYA